LSGLNIAFKISALDDFSKTMGNLDGQMGKITDVAKNVGATMTAMGTGMAVGLGFAAKSAMDFESQLSSIKAVTGATNDEMAKISDLAEEMGAKTKYSSVEAAQGIEELLKAGVSLTDVMGGGLEGALSLAVAGELELADAAEIASTALNAFKKDGLTVSKAADILAGAANASATSVGELKYGLSASAAVASAVGLSFKDTSTALAVFAQNGLKGSDAGTSLKTMLMNLQPATEAQWGEFQRLGLMTYDVQKGMQILRDNGIQPLGDDFETVDAQLREFAAEMEGVKPGTKKAEKAFRELAAQTGVMQSSFFDANGSIKSMDEIANLLSTSMSGLTDAQRLSTMETLFGSDAIRAANILFKEGADGVNKMQSEMSKVTALAVMEERMNNTAGAIEELKGALETASISIGSALLPAIRGVVNVLQVMIGWFNAMPDSMQSAVAIIGAVTAGLLLLAGPLLMLIGFLPSIASGFGLFMAAVTKLGPALTVLTGPIGLTIAAIAAIIGIVVLAYNKVGWFRDGVNAAWASIKSFTATAFNFIGATIKSVMSAVGTFLGSKLGSIKSLWAQNGEGIMSAVKLYFEAIKSYLTVVMGVIKGVFQVVWPIISGVVKVAWALIQTVIGTSIDLIVGWISVAMKLLKGDWSGAWETIKQTAKTIMTNIIGYFKGINLRQIGKDIIQGLINGIGSMIGGVKDAVKNIATSVKDTFKNLLDIHSPSRVMLQMGEYTAEGFEQGLKGQVNAIRAASSELAMASMPKIPRQSTNYVATAYAPKQSAQKVTIEVPLYLNGNEIARASVNDMNRLLSDKLSMGMRRKGLR
jgi:phage-related protein